MKYSGIKNSINVFAHREWAPDRKTDPRGIDMPKFRAAVAARLRKGPSKNIVVLKDIKVGKMHKDVVRIKRRLKKKGFIKKGTLPTPFYGKNLVKAYAAYQRSLGFKGSDASGAPGKTSLERLGFIVV
jgi:peptidoglycan hydrolase-like protein with peptidoglycan-binding domain